VNRTSRFQIGSPIWIGKTQTIASAVSLPEDTILRALLLQDQEETLAKQKAAEEKLNKLIDQYKALIEALQRAEAQLQAIPQPSLKTMPENQRSQQ
jgi:hypothetical protein